MREVIKLDAKKILPVQRKRVAAYARVSNGKNAMLHSLSTQISYYNNYIGSRGDWELAGIYADEAMTGTKDDRPEFQKMLADCRAGKIDMIITKSLTRFARNTVTLLSAVRELKSLEVDVYFEKENIHTLSTDGELMLTLLASFAQEESRSVSENQKWRVRKLFEQGRATNGDALGYRFQDGTFHIVPEEAEIVRQIFTDFLSGMGFNAIIKKLNHAGIPARRGGLWSETTISKKNVKNRGELPQYFVENSHDPIISREVFEQTQQELERRMKKFGITRNPHKTTLFTGLIRCGLCGKNFRHKIANAGKKCEKPVWCCSTFNTRGKNACPAQQIPENILIAKTAEVLDVTEFDRKTLMEWIKEIQVPKHYHLVYVFHDGHIEERTWQHKSRRESWTDEMKQKARENARRQAERRKK